MAAAIRQASSMLNTLSPPRITSSTASATTRATLHCAAAAPPIAHVFGLMCVGDAECVHASSPDSFEM